MSGKIAGPDPRKLYVVFGRLFIDISGLMYSFGLASFSQYAKIALHVKDLQAKRGNFVASRRC